MGKSYENDNYDDNTNNNNNNYSNNSNNNIIPRYVILMDDFCLKLGSQKLSLHMGTSGQRTSPNTTWKIR